MDKLFEALREANEAFAKLQIRESFADILTSVLKRAIRSAGHWELIAEDADMVKTGEHVLQVRRSDEPGKGKTYTVIIRPDQETHR